MAVTLVTLTADPATLVGADPDKDVRFTVRTNAGGAIIDAAGNKIFLGSYSAKVSGATTFSATLPPTNGATNPTNFQYQVDIEYVDAATGKRTQWHSGWFSLTTSKDLAVVAAEQYVPPTFMTTATATLQGYVDEGQALRDDQAAIAGLTGEDTAVEYLVRNPSATKTALSDSFAGKWRANTAYTAGQVVVAPDGGIVKALAAFTSGATYNAANWTAADGLTAQIVAQAAPRWQPNTAYTAGQSVIDPSGVVVLANATFTSGATYNAANWHTVATEVSNQVAASPTVTSAAASAVNTALANGGVLTVSTSPALDKNRAYDPQAKTGGGLWTGSGTTYNLTRMTGGVNLPTGITYGLEAARTGTLSGIIAQFLLGSKTASTDAWIVTPGEVISLGAYAWTDQASAQAYLAYQFYDAANAAVGSTVFGTATAIAANTWERRTFANITVPAGAHHVALEVIVGTITGNTVAGAKARTTGGSLVSGATAPTTYYDGDVLGWQWTGARFTSTSTKVQLSASEVATLQGLPARVTTLESTTQTSPLTLVKAGNVYTINTKLGSSTLGVGTSKNGSSNGAFRFESTTLDGTVIHSNTDDVTPIRTQFGAVGGNHGYANVSEFTNPDGKTIADLGSQWKDTAGRTYVLLAITTANKLVMGGDYTSPGGVVTSAAVSPTTNLTHFSGATHTGAIDYTTKVASQLYPSTQKISVTYWADGIQVTADGSLPAREVVVKEVYEVYDYGSLYDAAKANVGTSYTALTVASCVRVANTFRFSGGGRCRITQEIVELTPTTLAQCGAIQSIPLTYTGSTRTRYVPGVGTVGGVNWTSGVGIDSGFATTSLNVSDCFGPIAPLSLDVLTVSGSPVVGWAMGYLPYGARGDEMSRSATRVTHATTLFDMFSSTKAYPYYTVGEPAGWGRVSAEAFRAYLSPTEASAVLAGKSTALGAWSALDAAKQIA